MVEQLLLLTAEERDKEEVDEDVRREGGHEVVHRRRPGVECRHLQDAHAGVDDRIEVHVPGALSKV